MNRPTEVQITRKPADKKTGLTVAELREWLAEVERAGIDDGTRVEITSGFRSQITEVRARG